MANPLLLYSTNSLLAYRINERYYHDLHYVWCNPFFHKDAVINLQAQMVPSSTPAAIYLDYKQGVEAGDIHCQKVIDNRVGLRKGAQLKLHAAVITTQQFQEINLLIDTVQLTEYRPVVYVIPFRSVAKFATQPSLSAKAHPFSPEYLIEALPRKCFDVIEWR